MGLFVVAVVMTGSAVIGARMRLRVPVRHVVMAERHALPDAHGGGALQRHGKCHRKENQQAKQPSCHVLIIPQPPVRRPSRGKGSLSGPLFRVEILSESSAGGPA